jgi:hypothetical protein
MELLKLRFSPDDPRHSLSDMPAPPGLMSLSLCLCLFFYISLCPCLYLSVSFSHSLKSIFHHAYVAHLVELMDGLIERHGLVVVPLAPPTSQNNSSSTSSSNGVDGTPSINGGDPQFDLLKEFIKVLFFGLFFSFLSLFLW